MSNNCKKEITSEKNRKLSLKYIMGSSYEKSIYKAERSPKHSDKENFKLIPCHLYSSLQVLWSDNVFNCCKILIPIYQLQLFSKYTRDRRKTGPILHKYKLLNIRNAHKLKFPTEFQIYYPHKDIGSLYLEVFILNHWKA